MLEKFDDMMLRMYKEDAEKLGITLQEYMLFRILQKMDDLKVTTFSGEE